MPCGPHVLASGSSIFSRGRTTYDSYCRKQSPSKILPCRPGTPPQVLEICLKKNTALAKKNAEAGRFLKQSVPAALGEKTLTYCGDPLVPYTARAVLGPGLKLFCTLRDEVQLEVSYYIHAPFEAVRLGQGKQAGFTSSAVFELVGAAVGAARVVARVPGG